MEPKKKTRVLIVDDSEEIREAFSLLLEHEGFDVSSVDSASAAFDFVATHRPEVVLTDIMLHGPQGLDLITRLRSDLAPPVPAIIAWSGFRDFTEEALRRGAAAFLSKPVDPDDLSGAIDSAVSGQSRDAQQVRAADQHTQELRR